MVGERGGAVNIVFRRHVRNEPQKKERRRLKREPPAERIVVDFPRAEARPWMVVRAAVTSKGGSACKGVSAVTISAEISAHGVARGEMVSSPHITGIRYDAEFLFGLEPLVDVVNTDNDFLMQFAA